MNRLNSAVVEVSRVTGLDPSLISRFRSGARIPSQESDQIARLSNGLAELLNANSARENILRGCGLSEHGDLPTVLFQWFCAEDSGLGPPRRSRSHARRTTAAVVRRRGELMGFADKLNALMSAMEVSNVRLARQLEVDPSLISRYRKGMRAPAPGAPIVGNIAEFFSDRAVTDRQKAALWQCMGVRYTSDLNANLSESLAVWLTQTVEPQDAASLPLMDSFLDKLDHYSPEPQTSLEPLPPVPPTTKTYDTYVGNEGLREIVLRGLFTVLEAPEPTTIRLYTDLSLSWLISDTEYRKRWHALMQRVLSKGCKVIMIHDMERNVGEMITSIESWLPLYMTGHVEPYFSPRCNDARFAHTLLSAEGLGSVFGCCVAGMEGQAEYRYTDDSDMVARHTAQLEYLRQVSSPLMRIFSQQETEEYEQTIRALSHLEGDLRLLQPTLSSVTMPHGLMEKILTRAGYSGDELAQRLQLLDARRAFFEQNDQAHIMELSPLASDERLFSGHVIVDVPGIINDKPVYYTPEEYAQHIESLLNIIETRPNYSFQPLPDTPFENVRIVSRANGQVMAFRLGQPAAAFLFTHPLLCQTFDRYLDTLAAAGEKSCQGESVYQMLRKYLL